MQAVRFWEMFRYIEATLMFQTRIVEVRSGKFGDRSEG